MSKLYIPLASQARKQATQVNIDEENKILKEIEQEIILAIKSGSYFIEVKEIDNAEVLHKLKTLGYSIQTTENYDKRDGFNYTKISW